VAFILDFSTDGAGTTGSFAAPGPTLLVFERSLLVSAAAEVVSTLEPFLELLANPYARKRWLVSIAAWDIAASAIVNLYYSSDGFISRPTDTPSNQYFDARIGTSFSFSRSLFSSGKLGGRSVTGFGLIELGNADGGLDDLTGYSFSGRQVVVRLAGRGFSLAEAGVIFIGTADTANFGTQDLTLRLRDLQYRLEIPLSRTAYAGSGTWEGDSSIKGKRKPNLFGFCRGVEPILVDGPNLRFQVNERRIRAITAVYDSGVALSSSLYSSELSNGGFQLLTQPAGVITCDVQGDAPSGAYVDTVPDIIHRIAAERGSFTASEVVSTSFADLNSQTSSATVGYYSPAGSDETIGKVFDALINSIGGYYGITRSGKLDVGQITDPVTVSEASTVATYTVVEILDLERVPTAIPVWRLTLSYQKNWRVHSLQEIAGAASTRRTFLQNEFRTIEHKSSTILARHLLARDDVAETLLDDAAFASTETQRLHALYASDREIYRVRLKVQPFSVELGDVVRLELNRYNLDAGKNFRVISIVEDPAINEVVVELWG
jgi:hypothetical protein